MTRLTHLAVPFAFATALATLAAPASAEPGVIRDASGCRFDNPSPKPDEQVTWTGGCRDGWGDGQGTLRWVVNGVPTYTFIGSLVAGKLEGEGSESMRGDRYEGHFAQGHRHGQGVFTWSDGLRYEGPFVRGRMAGQGVLQLPDGTRFEGRFENDVLQAPALLVKSQAGGELRLPLGAADAAVQAPSPPASAVHVARIDPMGNCRPNYPPQALRQGAAGKSGFSLRIEPDAQVSRVRLDHRSGTDFAHQLLDLTALAALLGCPRTGAGPGGQAEWLMFTYAWKLE